MGRIDVAWTSLMHWRCIVVLPHWVFATASLFFLFRHKKHTCSLGNIVLQFAERTVVLPVVVIAVAAQRSEQLQWTFCCSKVLRRSVALYLQLFPNKNGALRSPLHSYWSEYATEPGRIWRCIMGSSVSASRRSTICMNPKACTVCHAKHPHLILRSSSSVVLGLVCEKRLVNFDSTARSTKLYWISY